MSETVKAAIENLPTLTAFVEDLTKTTVGLIVLVALVFFFLAYKAARHPLFQSLLTRNQARLASFEAYLASKAQDKSCKVVVADMRDAMMFQQATGIYAESRWRKGLVELHDKTDVSWLDMKRGWKFMDKDKDDNVSIRKFKTGDKLDYWWNLGMMWIFLILAAVVFVSTIVYKPSAAMVLVGILVATLVLACAAWAAMQNLPINAAKKIKAAL